MRINRIARLLPAFLLVSAVAFAASPIQLTSKGEKETATMKDGKKEVVYGPTDKVVPGDIVRFTNTYRNTGNAPADNTVINNPVPEHMNYVADTAFGEGATITFSIDKGKTFDVPDKLTKTEKGKKRKARADEYTNIRWELKTPVAPGKEGTVGFKARLK